MSRRRPLRLALAVALVAVIAGLLAAAWSPGGASAGPRGVAAAGPDRTLGKRQGRHTRRIYWGAWIGEQLTGTAPPWDMSALTRFEVLAGKRVSLLEFASPFAACGSSGCSFYGFPAPEMTKIRRHGAIPFFSWSSQSIPGATREPRFQLSDVIHGRYDRYIRRFARAAKRWGHPFFLRFNWEMNGDWFPWGAGANGNHRRQFRRAWRHVHRIFTRARARNVSWVWCPYVDASRHYGLRAFYPGGKFVDWTCLDGYNWGPGNPANSGRWQSFDQLFRSSYRRVLKMAPHKPMVIGEVASSDYGGSKAAWIRNMLARVAHRYRRVRGVIYFNSDDRGANWQIEASPAATLAFRRGIGRHAFVGSRFGRIRRSPIRPPRAHRGG